MLNKSLLVVLGIISLVWIGYVGISLVDFTSEPKPESVFNSNDKSIIVIHKPTEIDFTDSRIKLLEEVPFYLQLLSQTERVQHFYFSSNRKLVLMERSKPWTFSIIEAYATKLNLGATFSESNKKVKFSNGWFGYYSNKYFYLSEKEIDLEDSKLIDWKYVDRKSSSSIVTKKKIAEFEIENAYFINGKTIAYLSYSNEKSLPLVADQEVFQDVIPIDFDTYEFYEKAYLSRLAKNKTVFDDWVKYGIAKITKDDQECLVADFETGEQPLESICDFLKIDHPNEQKLKVKDLNLPFNLLKSRNIIIEIHNNLVFISSSQNFINNLIGNYEIGNTLAQSTVKKEKLFSKSPKKISYRQVTNEFCLSTSALNKSIHSVRIQLKDEEISEEQAQEEASLSPIRLDAQINSLIAIPNSTTVVTTTESNSIQISSKKQIIWSKQMPQKQIGEIQYNSIGNQLAVSHESGFVWFNTSGTILLEQEIQSVKSSPTLFTWRGESCIGLIANSGFVYFNSKGKQVQKTSLSGDLNNSKILMQVKKGELYAHIVTEKEWICLNTSRQRVVFRKNIGEGEWFLSKMDANVFVYGINKKQFVRYTENGSKSMLVGNCSKIVCSETSNNSYYGVLQGSSIYVIQSSNGTILAQFKTTLKEIEDIEIQQRKNGRLIVGLIDGIANNCYLYQLNGTELTKQSYEGSGKIALQNTNEGTLILSSQANGYLVRYPIQN
ncbi:MAG: hypothetical protein ACK476_12000 [Fluviicola sp.]